MPILASLMFPNAYGKVGGVAVTTSASVLNSSDNLQDAFVIKYSSLGKSVWAARISSSLGNDIGYGITSDSSGNIYVTGGNNSATTLGIFNADGSSFTRPITTPGGDAWLVKYNTNGIVQWVTRVSSSGTDIGFAVATDSSGNVYLTGSGASVLTVFNADGTSFATTLPDAGAGDAFIIKYDTNGIVQWVTRIGSTNQDAGYGIATDTSGNVYVTGQGGSAVTMTIFNSNGTTFGTLANSGLNDAFVVKYDTNGLAQWSARVASSQGDSGLGITTDSSANVYVTGSGGSATVTVFNANGTAFGTTLTNAGSGDAFIVKYNTSGFVQWVARVATTNTDIGRSIATDSSANVYITGRSAGTTTAFNANGTSFATTTPNSGGTDVFIVKYNTSGVVQWLARVASNGNDEGNGIAVDSGGNVYISGSRTSVTTAFNANGTSFGTTLPNSGTIDSFIVKYDTNGTVQWFANVASAGLDSGRAITVDQSNNIYTTGQFLGESLALYGQSLSLFSTLPNAGGSDAFIIKYNAMAVPQWVARIASVGNDFGYGTSTDSLGNVYVTGSGGNATVTVFNANGTAFGTTLTNTGSGDAFIVKYNTSGVAEWAAKVATAATDNSFDIITDSSGNVYITGGGGSGDITIFNADGSSFATTLPNTGGGDAFIVKYDTNGVAQWAAKVATTFADIGRSISVDSSGNVYVTGSVASGTVSAFNANGTAFGTTFSSNMGDVFVVKYDTNGTVQWLARIASGQSDVGYGIATDTSGNVYVTGQGGQDAIVTAFNANGTSFARTLAIFGSTDAFVVKYNTTGTVQWLAGIVSTGTEFGFSIATDTLGNVYVSGRTGTSPVQVLNADGTAFSVTLTTGDAFIVKYNTNGFVQWVTRVVSGGVDISYDLTTDSLGNVYVGVDLPQSATIFNSNGTVFTTILNGTILVKYDTNGFVQWVRVVSSSNSTATRGISVDSLGNICVSGITNSAAVMLIPNTDGTPYKILNSIGGNDVFIVKYSSNATPLWAGRVSTLGNSSDIGYAITTDSSGNAYVSGVAGAGTVRAFNADGTTFATGYTVGFAGEAFIVKYDTSGGVQWLARVGTPTGEDIGNGIATDSAGNVYMVGQHSADTVTAYNANGTTFATTLPSAGGLGAFIVKYNTSGTVQWLVRLASINDDLGTAIAVDGSGNVYVTGQLANTFTAYNANGTAFATTAPTAGGADAFIVKYDTNGTVQWLARIGSTGNDTGYGIATDTSGNVFVTGQGGSAAVLTAFNANGTAFGTTIANSGLTDAFLVKYNTSGVVQWVTRLATGLVDIGYSVTTDTAGNVIVSGIGAQDGSDTLTAFNVNGTAGYTSTSGNAGFVVKYNTNGTVLWGGRIVASTGRAICYSVYTDSAGSVYVTGGTSASSTISVFGPSGTRALQSTFTNTSGKGADAFVVKYDSSGNPQWISLVSGVGTDQGRGIALDSSSNIYTTGSFATSGLVASDA